MTSVDVTARKSTASAAFAACGGSTAWHVSVAVLASRWRN